jgi:glycogen debranching enzyme
MLWIDAICQQALSAELIAKLFEAVGDHDESKLWRTRYEEKKQVVQSLYWDKQDRFFYDIDCNTHKFYRIKTTASFWPLTAGLATEEQAKAMARAVEDPQTFGGSVPLLSLARDDADFSPNGNYWRGSLWLPTAYAALKGLARYGHHKEAHEAACKILAHMQKTYEEFEPHTIWECYSPTKPAPAVNEHNDELVRPDFCGWSALGPIAIYIEFVLGFHRVDAFGGVVEWEKPAGMRGRIGVRNLRFGEVVTHIEAEGERCRVRSNKAYTLRICGKDYPIIEGEQHFLID